MINTIKRAYNWTKDKVKKLWKWGIAIVIGGVVLAAVIPSAVPDVALEKMTEKYNQAPEIQANYQLKGASLVKNKIINPELDKYKNEPKDEIEITLGEENETNFVPSIKIKRWNEVWFKIKPRITADIQDQELEFSDNKIKFKTPEMEIEFEDFEEGEGGYKMIWYLNSKPASNVIKFDIESEGLDFFYQPPLTEEFQNGYSEEFQTEIIVTETQVKDLDENVLVNRPENIVGSYAVYHKTKGGMNSIYGKDYKVGKFGHIYRPRFIDSNGWEVWGNLHIENGIYSIEIPEDFYNNAVYPIKSNDTFGNTGSAGSPYTAPADRAMLAKGVPSGGDGIVDKLTARAAKNPNNQNIKAVIWLVADKTIITNGVGGIVLVNSTVQAWDMTYSTKPSVTDGVNYYVGVIPDGQVNTYYDWGSAGDGGRVANSYATPTTLGTILNTDRMWEIYATYTPSAVERRIIIIE